MDARRSGNQEALEAATVLPGEHGRPFAVKAIAFLLFLQGVAFLTTAILTVDWSQTPVEILLEQGHEVFLILLAVLTLSSTVGMLLIRPAAWLQAMVAQGLFLTSALLEYVRERPAELAFYGLMLLSLLIVIYLNYAEVPLLFRTRTQPLEGEEL